MHSPYTHQDNIEANSQSQYENHNNSGNMGSPERYSDRVAKKLNYEDQATFLVEEREELQPQKLSISKTPNNVNPRDDEVAVSNFGSERERLKAKFHDATRSHQANNSQYDMTFQQNQNTSGSYKQHANNQSNLLTSMENSSFIDNEHKSNIDHLYERDNNSGHMTGITRDSASNWTLNDSKSYGRLNHSHTDYRYSANNEFKQRIAKTFKPAPTVSGKVARSSSVHAHKYRYDSDNSFSMDNKIYKHDNHNTSMNEMNESRMKAQLLNDSAMLDEKYQSILKERRQKAIEFKHQAQERYQNRVMKYELENQMRLLENRLKRLHDEDFNIQKNIKKTQDITKKAIDAKKRYQEDLIKAENLKQKRLEEQERARLKILEERQKRSERLKDSMTNVMRSKMQSASQVKRILYQDSEKLDEKRRRDEERRADLHNSTFIFEKTLKDRKIRRQSVTKEQMNENHLRYLNDEHSKTMEIQDKIKQLAKQEEELINRIKLAHREQLQVQDYMQKVLKTKVDRKTPLKF